MAPSAGEWLCEHNKNTERVGWSRVLFWVGIFGLVVGCGGGICVTWRVECRGGLFGLCVIWGGFGRGGIWARAEKEPGLDGRGGMSAGSLQS